MKRFIFLSVAALLVSSSTGCFHHNTHAGHGGGCHNGQCGHGGGLFGLLGGRASAEFHETRDWRHNPPQAGPPGPPTGTYAYPYYTLRGPRDFLDGDPPSIGR